MVKKAKPETEAIKEAQAAEKLKRQKRGLKRESTKPGYPPEVIAKAGEMFRAGLLSVREIADRSGVCTKTIYDWVRIYDWERDLEEVVRAKVRRQAVVNGLMDETAAVDAAVAEQMAVLARHKKILNRSMDMIERLQSRLDPRGPEDAAAVHDSPADDEERPTLAQTVMIGKALSDIISKTIADTRKTYRMDDSNDKAAEIDALISEAASLAREVDAAP